MGAVFSATCQLCSQDPGCQGPGLDDCWEEAGDRGAGAGGGEGGGLALQPDLPEESSLHLALHTALLPTLASCFETTDRWKM